MELANAYCELNDPTRQKELFLRQKGRTEKQELDQAEEEFVAALECGMPPTVGFGMGLDRLVMLLTGQPRIKEVLAFPMLRVPYGDNPAVGECSDPDEM